MYRHHRYTDRIEDPMMALVRYKLERSYRSAEHQRLSALALAARPAATPARLGLRTWVSCQLLTRLRVLCIRAHLATRG